MTQSADGSTIMAQKTGSNVMWFVYDSDGTRVGFTYNGATYHYTTNVQGDVTGITDVDDNLVVEYDYDAWGKLLSTTGSQASTIGVQNPFLYRGYYYDSESGLYYLNSRYYDSQTGRFINADDINAFDVNQNSQLQYNLYAYCLNNPSTYVDNDGHFAILAAVAVGFAVGAVVGGVSAALQGKNAKGIMVAALGGGVAGAISVIPIPGLGAFGSAIIMGGIGNLTNNLIRGDVSNFSDVLTSLGCGAAASALGYGAGKGLIGIANKYWGGLSRAAQKQAITGLGKVSQKAVNIVLQQIKKGVTNNIYKQLVQRYGIDVVLSATVSAVGTEVKGK